MNNILNLADQLAMAISGIPEMAEKVEALNEVRKRLHAVSPFFNQPVDCVLWIDIDKVKANDYNPNNVAPPEMRLLYDSIKSDGYTQPVVTGIPIDTQCEINDEYLLTDGYHRNLVPRQHPDIKAMVRHYLPVTVLTGKTRSELMASTIRHNRARGSHDVELMGNIVSELHELGRSDVWIAKHLGMEKDEILRLKQITGITALFKDAEFSRAWEVAKGNE